MGYDSAMPNHVYKTVEITGTSSTTMEDAVNAAIARAARTVHNLRWFEVAEVRGSIGAGRVEQWQVTLKIGFTLDE